MFFMQGMMQDPLTMSGGGLPHGGPAVESDEALASIPGADVRISQP